MKTIVCALLVSLLPFAATASSLDGTWLTKKQDVVVKIESCGAALCGRIVWLRPDVTRVDTHGRPLCGQQVLSGFRPDPDGDRTLWVDGQIDKPDTDDHYRGQLQLADSDTLELRGYIGTPIIGKTKMLRRVAADTYPACLAR